MKIMQDKRLQLLLTPSNTPQFSAIENLFGYIKKKLEDLVFENKEQVSEKVTNTMFGLEERVLHGFYKKVLYNF